MDFLGIPIFDNDFYKMLFSFVLNFIFLTIIIKVLYLKSSNKIEYIFTYYMVSIIVFFLCFTLRKYDLDIGMALGLFAIFGIIRYRTDPVGIKEMSYLFIVIGISVINALANKNMSYAEIISSNVLVVGAIFFIEQKFLKQNNRSMKMIYEKIENINFKDDKAFLTDLKERLGIEVTHYEIIKIDYLKDSAELIIYYVNNVNDVNLTKYNKSKDI